MKLSVPQCRIIFWLFKSALARALDQGKFALMASIDLSSAFDVVNIDLLIKRLKIIGIPEDVVDLIKIWLNERSYYIKVRGKNSYIRLARAGTVQGSILGPLLYAIYVSPLFEIANKIKFGWLNLAYDSFKIKCKTTFFDY